MGECAVKDRRTIEMTDLLDLLRGVFEPLNTLDSLAPDTNLHRDIGLDSLGFVRLQVAIEDFYGVRFDPMRDDLAQSFETAGSLLALVRDLKGRPLK